MSLTLAYYGRASTRGGLLIRTMRLPRIHICTYNVNGKFCDANQDLSKWILPQEQPDLLVAG